MSLSNNISGYKIQTVNLTAGQYAEVTGPGRGFEVLQSGEDGTRTIIQALRDADGYYSDNTGVQAFNSSPGLNVVNFDKLTILATVDSQLKIKIYTSKNVATVNTGPDMVAHKTLWSTNVAAMTLAKALEPYELTGVDNVVAGAFSARGDGMRELRYSDRAAINNAQDFENPANSFAQIHNTVNAKWAGWIAADQTFSMDVYACPYVNPGAAMGWQLVQTFNSTVINNATAIAPTDAPETFTLGANVITFDGRDNFDYAIPYGSLRVFLSNFQAAATTSFRGILAATAHK